MFVWNTQRIEHALKVTAPDGSLVEIGPATKNGSFARFSLEPGKVSKAVRHRSVEEIWFITQGQGQMWRKLGNDSEIVNLSQGLILTIPPSVTFQFKNTGNKTLQAVAITMPPWPGEEEAIFEDGTWPVSSDH